MGERDSRNGRVVLIWDLDESLILFHSLINGAFAKAHGPEVGLPASLTSSLQCEQATPELTLMSTLTAGGTPNGSSLLCCNMAGRPVLRGFGAFNTFQPYLTASTVTQQ